MPRLPTPPLIPRAVPFSDLGKKLPMYAIEDEKLAPAKPIRAVKIINVA